MADEKSTKRSWRFKDLTGQRFEKSDRPDEPGVTVLAFAGMNEHGKATYRIRCDCGNDKTVVGASLTNGLTTSCGCWRAKAARKTRLAAGTRDINGRNKTPECYSWRNMIDRCRNRRRHNSHRYVGRGITVCKGLRGSFQHFLDCVGSRPEGMSSIDRIDNDGNYSCGSCEECSLNKWPLNIQWETAAAQSRNRSDNVYVVIDGKQTLLVDAAKEHGADYYVAHGRVKNGWDHKAAVTLPTGSKRVN